MGFNLNQSLENGLVFIKNLSQRFTTINHVAEKFVSVGECFHKEFPSQTKLLQNQSTGDVL